MFVAISGSIVLPGKSNFLVGFTTDWIKDSGKYFLQALYGVSRKMFFSQWKLYLLRKLYGDKLCTLKG